MNKFTIRGTFFELTPEQNVGKNGNEFWKCQLIITQDYTSKSGGTVTNYHAFDVTGDEINTIMSMRPQLEGHEVEGDFYLTGRRWEGRNGVQYFTSMKLAAVRLADTTIRVRFMPSPASIPQVQVQQPPYRQQGYTAPYQQPSQPANQGQNYDW